MDLGLEDSCVVLGVVEEVFRSLAATVVKKFVLGKRKICCSAEEGIQYRTNSLLLTLKVKKKIEAFKKDKLIYFCCVGLLLMCFACKKNSEQLVEFIFDQILNYFSFFVSKEFICKKKNVGNIMSLVKFADQQKVQWHQIEILSTGKYVCVF